MLFDYLQKLKIPLHHTSVRIHTFPFSIIHPLPYYFLPSFPAPLFLPHSLSYSYSLGKEGGIEGQGRSILPIMTGNLPLTVFKDTPYHLMSFQLP